MHLFLIILSFISQQPAAIPLSIELGTQFRDCSCYSPSEVHFQQINSDLRLSETLKSRLTPVLQVHNEVISPAKATCTGSKGNTHSAYGTAAAIQDCSLALLQLNSSPA